MILMLRPAKARKKLYRREVSSKMAQFRKSNSQNSQDRSG